jgi:hypothetical protein
LTAALAVLMVAGLSSAAVAQDMEQQFFIEVRGGFNVPTFDIADAADPGPSLGGTFGVMVAPKVWLMAEGDFGFHGGADGGADIDVFHYMGKVGYNVLENEMVSVLLNAGAGAMTFKPDGGESTTYAAINVGGKIAFAVSEQIAIVVSPQGDIAFSDDPSTSWVWPFTAGLRVNF